jgi:two-component system C4-dicarboxylate transport response regulator DctD
MRHAIKQFVVIVDDDQAMRDSISDYLDRVGYHVMCFQSGREMLSEVENLNIGVIVCDLKMPGMNGIEVLKALKSQGNTSPFILITAFGDIPTAVKAINMGAFDFIEKPFVPQILRETIDMALEHRQIEAGDLDLNHHLNTHIALDQLLIGQSVVMTKFRQEVIDCASTLHNLLLIGEEGVEKALVARVIHQHSPHRKLPFIHVNCNSVSESLFSKTLLGPEGAFERVGDGVIFLDKLDSMPFECRSQLLSLLEKNIFQYTYRPKVNVKTPKIICSVSLPPRENEVNTFIGKICLRIGKVHLKVPPLRDRPDDIIGLFNKRITQAANEYQISIPPLSAEDVITLSSYHWPKNQQQLKQIADRFALLNRTKHVTLNHLLDVSPIDMINMASSSNKNLRTLTQDFEKQLIIQAMIECSGNITQVCSLLKIPRRTLNEKLLKHDLTRTKFL